VDPQYVQAAIRDIAGSVFTASSCSAIRSKLWRRRARGSLLEHTSCLSSRLILHQPLHPAARKDAIQNADLGEAREKYNAELCDRPNGVKRDTYDFKAHKNDIVTTLNDWERP